MNFHDNRPTARRGNLLPPHNNLCSAGRVCARTPAVCWGCRTPYGMFSETGFRW